MYFTNTSILYALLALVVPLAVHLVGRRRRRVVLPTARLAAGAHAASRGALWVRRAALLSLRLAAAALAVLAVARPRLGPGPAAAKGRPADGPWIVCLDTSASMLAVEGGQTRLQAAAGALDRALAAADQGADAWLVATGDPPWRGTVGGLRGRLAEPARVGWSGEPLGRMIHRALAACRPQARPMAAEPALPPGTRLIIATDATPHALRDLAPGALKDLDAAVLLLLVGGKVENAHLGLPEAATVEAGGARHLSVQVVLAPRRAGGSETVRLALAGDARSWTATATETRPARFLVPVAGDGPWQGRVSTAEPDILGVDSTRYFTAAALPRARLLVVDAGGPDEADPRAAFHVAAAFAADLPGLPMARKTVAAAQATAAALDAADAVFWGGPEGPPDAAALGRFVAGGGGLVWVPAGPDPPAADLAALLGVAFDGTEDLPDGVTMDPGGYASDLLGAFEGGTGADISRPVFRRRLLITPRTAARGVSFMDRRPAVSVRRIGRGRAVALAVGPSRTWGDLGARPEFVVLVHSILESLAKGGPDLNVVLGRSALGRRLGGPGHGAVGIAEGGAAGQERSMSANVDPAETADLGPRPERLKAALPAGKVSELKSVECGVRSAERPSDEIAPAHRPVDPAAWLAVALAAVLAAEALAAAWRPTP